MRRRRERQTSAFAGLGNLGVTWPKPTVAVEMSYGRVMQGWLREPDVRRAHGVTLGPEVQSSSPCPIRSPRTPTVAAPS